MLWHQVSVMDQRREFVRLAIIATALWSCPTRCAAPWCSCARTTRCWRGSDYCGNFDPFGDFDPIFGATKQNLKIIETPIRYKARMFDETQISGFRDGWLLQNGVVRLSEP